MVAFDDVQDETIERLLRTAETIAVVGLSSQQTRPGYYVPAYLQRQGYRIIPVNPNLDEALGEQAYASLRDIPESIDVDIVQLFRRPEKVPPSVEEAIEIGARAVWMQSGIVNREAAERARAAGLDVVMDACMMVEHRRRMG